MTRGEIWLVDFGIPQGSVAGYRRPAVVLQNNDFNKSEIHTSIVIPLTSNLLLADCPLNVFIPKQDSGLSKDSVVIIPLVTALDKQSFIEKISAMPQKYMKQICSGLAEIFEIDSN